MFDALGDILWGILTALQERNENAYWWAMAALSAVLLVVVAAIYLVVT
jgi:hypothetical protein